MPPARFNLTLDQDNARLLPAVRQALRADTRRINIVGASGWIGRTTAALLHEALGAEIFAERVACFGSHAGTIDLDGLSIAQRPIVELPRQARRPTLLFNLAFLTMDKVGAMPEADYVGANRAISETVLTALEPIGVDRLFLASSGAAAFADDPAAAPALRLYGGLKRDDEARFAEWALAAPERRRTVTARIFSLSGPWINKPEVYALASFILDALQRRPVQVRAPLPVWRSYVAVREVVSLVLSMLLAEAAEPSQRFDTGGRPVELEQLAGEVAHVLGRVEVRRAVVSQPGENRYIGDEAGYASLLRQHGLAHLPLCEQIAETAAYLARRRSADPVAAGAHGEGLVDNAI